MLSITKLQNLKAIHNEVVKNYLTANVVINHKTTKFESNSQLQHCTSVALDCCYQSQNYKIWKQFTTLSRLQRQHHALLSITKLQNLKAIHNGRYWRVPIVRVVINHKTTKFESNSQLSVVSFAMWYSCYQSQNYKIWKQFTTLIRQSLGFIRLLSITKLQNLKAIHNCFVLPNKVT